MTDRNGFVLSTDGTQIWADAAGDPSKPAIVFIHGYACTSLVFEKQFADNSLLQALHLIRYDCRGHGRSGKPDDAEAYRSARQAEDFHAVCEAFGVRKPFVAAWSIGGAIVVDVIETYGSEYISGIIYFGSILWKSMDHEIVSRFLIDLIPSLTTTDLATWCHAGMELVNTFVADPEGVPYQTKLAWLGGATLMPPNVRLHVLGRTQDATRFLQEGGDKLPTLVIQGLEDRLINVPNLVRKVKEVFKNVDIQLLDGVGHAPFYERSMETGRLILEFINEVSREHSRP